MDTRKNNIGINSGNIENAHRGVGNMMADNMIDGREDPFNLIPFQQKDKFEKFYDRKTDDYIFKIENLPEAFEKLDETESASQEKLRVEEIINSSKSPSALLMEKFVDKSFLETESQIGYFSAMNSSFKSSGDDIKKNYVKKI